MLPEVVPDVVDEVAALPGSVAPVEGVEPVESAGAEPVDVDPVDADPVEPVDEVEPVEPVDEVEPVDVGAEVDEPVAGFPEVQVTELPSAERTQFICEPDAPTVGVDDDVGCGVGVVVTDLAGGAGRVTTRMTVRVAVDRVTVLTLTCVIALGGVPVVPAPPATARVVLVCAGVGSGDAAGCAGVTVRTAAGELGCEAAAAMSSPAWLPRDIPTTVAADTTTISAS